MINHEASINYGKERPVREEKDINESFLADDDASKTNDIENQSPAKSFTEIKMLRTKAAMKLSWENVNISVKAKKGKAEKMILEDVWGETTPGETLAVLGPSGAGKTSLFYFLAGRIAAHSADLAIEGKSYIGGKIIDNQAIRKSIAYVAQEDSLHISSTPREAIYFSARLRLPKSITNDEISTLVNNYIKELGLEKCADTVIGAALKKGISGGERKRTSVAVELVVSPSIVLLDEPTSGLDSFSAAQLVRVLNKVASSGASVLFTIHQPSSEVFAAINRCIILNRGRVMYCGKTSTAIEDFNRKGYPVPSNYNTAEWALSVAQSESDESLEKNGFYYKEKSLLLGVEQPIKNEETTTISLYLGQKETASLWTELILLLQREKYTLARHTEPMITNLIMTTALSLVFGVFFWQVGNLRREDATDLQAQQGTLQNIQISTMLAQHSYALMTLPIDRPLFLREYATNHYSVFPYFISKLVTEAIQIFAAILIQSTITYFMIGFQLSFIMFFLINFILAMTATAIAVLLGAIVSDLRSVTDLYALLTVPQFFFSGVFAPIDVIPKVVRWAQYLCSLKYAAGLAMLYEFGNCEPGLAQENCQTLLARNNVSKDDEWWFWVALLGLFVGFRTLALLVIKKRATVFK